MILQDYFTRVGRFRGTFRPVNMHRMKDVTIYHNPLCGTSRNVLGILRENGIEPSRQEWVRPGPILEGPTLAAYVGFTRRRLCVAVDREPEIAAYLAEHPPRGRPSVVLWWDK